MIVHMTRHMKIVFFENRWDDIVEEDDSFIFLNVYNNKEMSNLRNSENKDMLLNHLNDIYICKNNEKQHVMKIIKRMKNAMEKVHGNNKWNILFSFSDCCIRSFIHDKDNVHIEKNVDLLKEKILFYNEEYCIYNNKENELNEYTYNPIVEYVALPRNKEVHEICISNNIHKNFIKNNYKIMCFQPTKISYKDFLKSKLFYKSINYTNFQTRNITQVTIDFSYMDDKMKNNFKQHVINEFVNNPNITKEDLSNSLFHLATYFYHEKNKEPGTWCVFISEEKGFAGAVNIVKNKYLRMTAQNKNKKYNILVFKTPAL